MINKIQCYEIRDLTVCGKMFEVLYNLYKVKDVNTALNLLERLERLHKSLKSKAIILNFDRRFYYFNGGFNKFCKLLNKVINNKDLDEVTRVSLYIFNSIDEDLNGCYTIPLENYFRDRNEGLKELKEDICRLKKQRK